MCDQINYTYDLFISYSHHDSEWVRETLLPRLESEGLRVCIDYRDFEIGVPNLINMERAVDGSHHTLIVLTPSWRQSEWTEFESLLASATDPAGRRRKLIPLMLAPCELPSRIAMLTCADFTQPDERPTQFRRLLNQLRQPQETPKSSSSELPTFVAGPPIAHPRQFFGRRRELRRLFNLWRRPPLQNAAIIGPRRSGKTSLLLYLKAITTTHASQLRHAQRRDWLPRPDRYQWVFVDFQDPRLGSPEGLLRHLLRALDFPVPDGCDLNRFMDIMSRKLRTPTVVLLDEIGVALQRYSELDDIFWEGLRSLATNQVRGNLAFVLAGSEPPYQLARHSSLGSPFFNIFGYAATLGPLTEPEAREMIARSPIPFPADDAEWILEQSGRWPMLLQILCRERLVDLRENDCENGWREEGLRQMRLYQHLLT
jgi:hypothetical protein